MSLLRGADDAPNIKHHKRQHASTKLALWLGAGYIDIVHTCALMDELLDLKDETVYQETTGLSIHQLKSEIICTTEPTASNPTPESLVLDATDGIIPLWKRGSVLHWRFNFESLDK